MTSSGSQTEPVMITEASNPATANIDLLSTLDMVKPINAEDDRVAKAVAAELTNIASAVDAIADRMRAGGRLIYLGAGTSGRLGVLDAAECMPTFNIPDGLVIGIIAGGNAALKYPIENAEDDAQSGVRDIQALQLTAKDSLVGIAASGQTPYTLGGMMEARRVGALVISVTCNHPSPMAAVADIHIAPITGPEVINGSTRLKAGTAQKMVLNILSTGVMIRLGKTYGNLMVDVQPTNAKLRDRARRIVEQACNLSSKEAADRLEECGGEVKVAIVSTLACISPEEARRRLDKAHGSIRFAFEISQGLQ